MTAFFLSAAFISFVSVVGTLMVLGVAWLYENRRYSQRRLHDSSPHLETTPRATVIVPCLTNTAGLRETLSSYLRQDYNNLEVVFVVDDRQSRAARIVKAIIEENRFMNLRIVVSTQVPTASHQLEAWLTGVMSASLESEVLAFGNCDVRVSTTWLRRIVKGLSDPAVGAVTGSVWQMPRHQTFGNRLRAIYQNTISTFQGPGNQIILSSKSWGIRSRIADQLELKRIWQQAIDDTWPTIKAIKSAGLKIVYAPQCHATCAVDSTFFESVNEIHRQTVLGRINAPWYWLGSLCGMASIQVAYALTAAATIFLASQGHMAAIAFGLAHIAIYVFGVIRILIKNSLCKMHLPDWRVMRRTRNIDVIAWPVFECLVLCLRITSWFSNTIRWDLFQYRLNANGAGRLIAKLPQPNDYEVTEGVYSTEQTKAA